MLRSILLHMFLTSILFANYVSLFGQHPLNPSLVQTSLTKVVAVHSNTRFIQVVIESPTDGSLVLLKYYRTPTFMGYQFPFSLISKDDIVQVCHFGDAETNIEYVDVDCDYIRRCAFFLNAFQFICVATLITASIQFVVYTILFFGFQVKDHRANNGYLAV